MNYNACSDRTTSYIAGLWSGFTDVQRNAELEYPERAERRTGVGRRNDPDTVRINQNENPMGPCKEGLEAMFKIAPMGWRYSPGGEDGHVTLRLYADNIADKRYWSDTGASYGDTFIWLGAPATVRLSAHYTF